MATLNKLLGTDKDGKEVRVDDYYFDPKTDIIYFVKRMDGKLVRFSTGVKRPNIRKAKEVANYKLRGVISRDQFARTLIGPLIDDYLEESFKDAARGALDVKTVSKRRQIMNVKIRPFWENKRPDEITAESWAEFLDWFVENFEGQRIFNVIKYMRHFTRYLSQRRVNGKPVILIVPILKNPFANKERKERAKRKARTFTAVEVQSILKVCPDREKLLVLLMYTMGFRVNEACSLKWENLDLEKSLYRFGEEDNKAGHEGSQAINSHVLKLLSKWPVNGPYVFPQERDTEKCLKSQMIDWKAIKAASGITWPWSPHTFRHACLTQLFLNPQLPQAAIMKCFRISYKVALEHYIHVDDKARNEIKDAVEVLL